MSAKGENPASFVKHEAIERLARGQVARARLFLNAGDHVAIIDMHAGDGRGVVQPEPDLFRGDESTATPILATGIGEALRRDGYRCDVLLCEKNRDRRSLLTPLAERGAQILGNHATLPPLDYRWALVFNDPNGHGAHGDDVLRRVAQEVPKADFLIVVNEASLSRHIGVNPEQEPGSFAANVAASATKHAWRLAPPEWARLLGRRQVIVSKSTYGRNAMKGRILLVSNAPQRTPRGYSLVSLFNRGGQSGSAPPESSSGASRGRDRGHPKLPFAAGF